MKRLLGLLLLCSCAHAPPAPTTAAPPASEEQVLAAVKQAGDAYGRKDWPAFLEATRAAAKLSPENPDLRWRVARALVLDGKGAEGVAELDRLAAMKLVYPVAEHPDLVSVREAPAFVAVAAKMAANAKPIEGGETGWMVPGDVLVEAIAHDPDGRAFYLSSIHQGKVMKIGPDGHSADLLVLERDGAMGLALDAKQRVLWVGTAALPPAKGYTAAADGRSAILKVNLDTGRIEQRLEAPGKHVLGDLALSPGGEVYVSDSVGGAIFRVAGDRLEEVIPPGRLRSPQGIAFTPDGKRAYVADYALGIYVLDVARKTVTPMPHADDVAVYGIDGLIYRDGKLFALQNGTRPHRLVRLTVGDQLERAEILDLNDSVVEPTNGVFVGDTLYYVATSQWQSFGDAQAASHPPAVIRKLVAR